MVSWASLAFQPEFTATASNIGYCWWSHDIGGHTRGVRDDELATRWVQFGVFSPIMRLHSANNPFIRKEPWVFPPEHRAAMNDALRFRHRMVPYLHTMNHEPRRGRAARAADVPPGAAPSEAYCVPNQYAFGSELLVAPITEPRDAASLRGQGAGVAARTALWTDIFTDAVYQGGRTVELHRDRRLDAGAAARGRDSAAGRGYGPRRDAQPDGVRGARGAGRRPASWCLPRTPRTARSVRVLPAVRVLAVPLVDRRFGPRFRGIRSAASSASVPRWGTPARCPSAGSGR